MFVYTIYRKCNIFKTLLIPDILQTTVNNYLLLCKFMLINFNVDNYLPINIIYYLFKNKIK